MSRSYYAAKLINSHSFLTRNTSIHRGLPHLRLRRGSAQAVLAQEPGRLRERRLSPNPNQLALTEIAVQFRSDDQSDIEFEMCVRKDYK